MTATETIESPLARLAARLEELDTWCPDPLREALLAAARVSARNAEVDRRVEVARSTLAEALDEALDDAQALDEGVGAVGCCAARLVALERVQAACGPLEVPGELVTEALTSAMTRIASIGQTIDVEPPLYAQLLGEWRRHQEGSPPAALPGDLQVLDIYSRLRQEVESWNENVEVVRDVRGRVGVNPLDVLGAAKSLAERAVAHQAEKNRYRQLCAEALDARRAAGLPTDRYARS